MTNPEVSPQESEPSTSELVVRMNDFTERKSYLSTLQHIVESPDYLEILERGEEALPYILADKEQFSHWHLMATFNIAAAIGESIEIVDGAKPRFTRGVIAAIKWLEDKYPQETSPTEIL